MLDGLDALPDPFRDQWGADVSECQCRDVLC